MFQIGDTVVKPSLGICKIKAIRKMTVENAEKQFYVLQSGDVKVMVPFETAHSGGLRYAMDEAALKEVEDYLAVPFPLQKDERESAEEYEVNLREVESPVKKRIPKTCSEVMKRLFYKSKLIDLDEDEAKMFREASKILAEEIAYLQHTTRMKAANRLKAIMTDGRKSRKDNMI